LHKGKPKCTDKSSPPNLYDCYRAVNPRKADEIDEELRRIDPSEIETGFGGGLHETHSKDKIPHPNRKD
jgi:hypothetical protein